MQTANQEHSSGDGAGQERGLDIAARAHPLRRIVARPSQLEETLECGHTNIRMLGLGENAQAPSNVMRRRCYLCIALTR